MILLVVVSAILLNASLVKNKLNKEIMELVIECDALNEAARKLIEDKKSDNVDFNEIDSKYDILVKKHKEVSGKLHTLEERRSQKAAAACRVKMHIKALKNTEEIDSEFKLKLWTMLLEKAVVSSDGKTTFYYYSGYKNQVTIV